MLFARRGSSEAPAALQSHSSTAEFLRRVEDDREAREVRLQVGAPALPPPDSGSSVSSTHPARCPRLHRGTSTCTRPTGVHRINWADAVSRLGEDQASAAQMVRKMQQRCCRPALMCRMFHRATESFDTCSLTPALHSLITCEVCRCIPGSIIDYSTRWQLAECTVPEIHRSELVSTSRSIPTPRMQ